LHELDFSQSSPTTIHCDNQNVIALNENLKNHSRSKHVESQYYFTQKKVLDKQIQLKYVSTLDMTIDIFIKSLPRNKHFQCIENSKRRTYFSTSRFDDISWRKIFHFLMWEIFL
jgi:hypothetical protein